MADVLLRVLGFLVRLGLVLAGLVFFASLLAVGLFVLMLWLLRALWARLTGQPVSPWTFQMNRQAVWQRFTQRGFGSSGAASSADNVVDVPAHEVGDANVVTDVEPKRITPR